MVFQDAGASLTPWMAVGELLAGVLGDVALHIGAIEMLKDLRDTAPLDEGHSAGEHSS